MMNKFKKGFSLIELLIVIAIIGILSTIILNSLSTSRARAYDSKVKQQLTNFRTAAEMYFSNHDNTYGPATNTCGGVTNTTVFNNFESTSGSPGLYIAAGNLPDFSQVTCDSTDSAYAIKVTLYSGNEYWCVDNKGFSGLVSGMPASGISCL